jgi:hypothetical protein
MRNSEGEISSRPGCYYALVWALLAMVCTVGPMTAAAEPVVLTGEQIRVSITPSVAEQRELIEIRDGDTWAAALDTPGAVTRQRVSGEDRGCNLTSARLVGTKIVTKARCDNGRIERELELGPDADMIAVRVRFRPKGKPVPSSVEDRMFFAPLRRRTDTPLQGPLDFVWSQNIKASFDDLVPHWAFKAPAVILQQAGVFAAIVPRVDLLTAKSLQTAPPALDLDVTSNDHTWFSYGIIPTKPSGHSYFRRDSHSALNLSAGPVEYEYWILASAQPEKLGYRRVAQLLWERFGGPELKHSMDLQRNTRRPELFLFDDWRKEAWTRYANEKYWEFDCDGERCGALTSNRNPWGKWNDAPKEDAWFNSWFQNLRTAYGWYLYSQRTHDSEMKRKAEQILNLALKSPQHNGVFSTIYLHDTNTWLRDDGWAGYPDDYHTFCMSWTAYWMLRWANDLVPARKPEILAYLRPYADFLLKAQEPSGCIPSWFDQNLQPREEFRDFNAETAGSALFLAEFAEIVPVSKYLDAAIKAQDFISQEVLPRQRWYDFETFLSCARKHFDFYDRWTAQYPQNNLSQMQAVQAYLELYRLTGSDQYLKLGQQLVDYLLLTQQVWNHPLFTPKLLGGTTTQNTDAEWSDARQGYLATILLDYYNATCRKDYLERSVAAARAGFAVAPWENWAHTGHVNEPGALTGIHWGTGSQMASVEMMSGLLGDAFVNVAHGQGVGFNACTLNNLQVSGTTIAFTLRAERSREQSRRSRRHLLVRFASLDPNAQYRLIVNRGRPLLVGGQELLSKGLSISVKTVK